MDCGNFVTEEEAKKIADTIQWADGGCYVCVGSLCDSLESDFPQFNWHKLVAEANGYWTEEKLRSIND